ncbi:MAG: flagellar type III secretion system protein FlhB [Labilithrix sp.]|nr:flagellar type III secretion system protein FlhB [Labilithrix sp.]
MAESHGEKSFEATDARREEFRKQGRYAKAKDLGGLVATAAVLVGLFATRAALRAAAQNLFERSIGDLSALERLGVVGATRAATSPIVGEVSPLLAAAAVLAVLASAAQVGFRINTDAISVKLDRLDPKSGLERLFAFKTNLVELGLSLLRVSAVGVVAWQALARELPVVLAASRAPVAASAEGAVTGVLRVVVALVAALFVLAAIDYAQAWFSLQKEMRMTRQERMDEARQQDGDPKAKGRMKARARALARQRAIGAVKGADAIVTNPTHVAVALRYGPRDAAPVVVAKGVDEVALRIREEGRRHAIPILENRPLARALNAEVPVGRPVPQAHFAAVAQVLAFVYRLKKRGAFGGTRRA